MQWPKLKHRLGVNSFLDVESLTVIFLPFKGSYSLELRVVDNICADVILGLDLKMHRSTIITAGRRQPIRVGDKKVCSVAAANVKSPRIFQFLNPKVRPISTFSRRFNAEDCRFITEKINKLLDQGIIEHSESPKDERQTQNGNRLFSNHKSFP